MGSGSEKNSYGSRTLVYKSSIARSGSPQSIDDSSPHFECRYQEERNKNEKKNVGEKRKAQK
jgi:hypothetical protein